MSPEDTGKRLFISAILYPSFSFVIVWKCHQWHLRVGSVPSSWSASLICYWIPLTLPETMFLALVPSFSSHFYLCPKCLLFSPIPYSPTLHEATRYLRPLFNKTQARASPSTAIAWGTSSLCWWNHSLFSKSSSCILRARIFKWICCIKKKNS